MQPRSTYKRRSLFARLSISWPNVLSPVVPSSTSSSSLSGTPLYRRTSLESTRSFRRSNRARTQPSSFGVFLDFDGTVVTQESESELMTKLGFGSEKRKKLNRLILAGDVSIQEGYRRMVDDISSQTSYEDALELARNTYVFDAGFKTFFHWCKNNDIPVVIVSSGMRPAIHAALEQHLGAKDAAYIRIISNDVQVDPHTGRFHIVFRHPASPHGHVKSVIMDQYRGLSKLRKRSPPLCLFVGDGVSDVSAARSADLLFVKMGKESHLATYCKRENIPYKSVGTFFDVLHGVARLVEGGETIDDLLWETTWGLSEKNDELVENDWALLCRA